MNENSRWDYQYAEDDRVNEDAYTLMEKIFGQKMLFISNEFPIDTNFDFYNIPGREIKLLDSLSWEEQLDYYKGEYVGNYILGDDGKKRVWYPAIHIDEWQLIYEQRRRDLLERIEEHYKIRMLDYPIDRPINIIEIIEFMRLRGVSNFK